MSRIGRLPIRLPEGVDVKVSADNVVAVKGPKGELSLAVDKAIGVDIADRVVTVRRSDDEKEHRAKHGLYRKLIFNMVEGVSKGFEKTLIVNGVGYKVNKTGNKLVLNVGYSHPVEIEEPQGITLEAPDLNTIVVKGIDKELVGQVAANIKFVRIPDPYHVYGIRYKDEEIVRKEGKKAGK